MIRFRNRDILTVPKWYIFQAVAETLLQNVYHVDGSHDAVVVDIGASIGDFMLIASRPKDVRVYSFDPDPVTFQYLQRNIAANGREMVRTFNRPANEKSLEEIFQTYGESEIDLLKIDCEGYEYTLLPNCPSHVLSKVRRISMEIHPIKGHDKKELVEVLKGAGFTINYVKEFGQGPYIYAWRDGSWADAEPSRTSHAR
jgi:tRNA G37 N-methylase Trm5